MDILTFNCGSSSLKYKLLRMPEQDVILGGEAQRVGPPTSEPSRILHRIAGETQTIHVPMPSLSIAFQEVMKLIEAAGHKPDCIGHRIVHGASVFATHTFVDNGVIERLRGFQNMAPLHNPPAIDLAQECLRRYPGLPQVAVFDTVFHSTIPAHAYTYSIPAKLGAELGIRKYGFHGISHGYVARETARLLHCPLEQVTAVSCHLGSGGASLCAIQNGRSIDNTMGYSPLQGLMMSTRCGDLDPAVALRLVAERNGDFRAVNKQLNTRSGVLGMSGLSADIRDVISRNAKHTATMTRSRLAEQFYVWRIRKYLGAYLAILTNPMAVVFTDTIGETVPEVRWSVCADMDAFGMRIDHAQNQQATSLPADIAAPDSRVRILVIAADEELAIARESYELMEKRPEVSACRP